MIFSDIINKTKRSISLNKDEIFWLVKEFTENRIPDYQFSAWLMAVRINGLTDAETFWLTSAMMQSGDILNMSELCLGSVTADKHSTGGVGDKISIIIGPIVAACGVKMPKMSGRGLGHTGGTVDKLESIPGYRTELPIEEFIHIVNETGFSIISQSGNICPADKKIYALRDVTGTVDSIPLICASIMSKKLAVSADCILLDVKYGSGAFMKTKDEAKKLGGLMKKIGMMAGKKCDFLVSDMNMPFGYSVGNSLEIIESIEFLKGKKNPLLHRLCVSISSAILEKAGKETENGICMRLVESAISSGKALEILRKTIELHGGNPRVIDDYSLFEQPKYSYTVNSPSSGIIFEIDSEKIGVASLMLGAGRLCLGDKIDMSAGIVLNKTRSNHVVEGEPLMTLYSSKISDFSEVADLVYNAIKIGGN